MLVLKALTILHILTEVVSQNSSNIIRGSGDFSVNAIFPLKKSPNKVDFQNGVILAEAMLYAIDQVNKVDYLHGYKLKVTDVYDCNSETQVREKVLESYLAPVQFLIGPFSSETSYFASILTDTFLLPSISYSATYSDFGRFGVMQRYMFRTVPSDEYRILAALNFIRQSAWTYVGIINSHGYDGERDAVSFIQKLPEYGACLSSQNNLPKFKTSSDIFEKAVDQMAADKRLKAIVLFTSNKDSWSILNVLKAKSLYGRFYILCMYGCTNYLDVVEGNEEIANGTLSLYLHNTENEDFKQHFLKLKPNNHPFRKEYFDIFWENVFKCNQVENNNLYQNNCSGAETLSENKGYYPLTPVHTVLDAVYGIAHSIRKFIEKICNKAYYARKKYQFNYCIINPKETHRIIDHVVLELNKMIYKDGTLKITDPGKIEFDTKGKTILRYDVSKYKYNGKSSSTEMIWSWRAERHSNTTAQSLEENKLFSTVWMSADASTSIKSKGICSLPCGIGEFMDHDRNYFKAKCCWTCRMCPVNNIVVNNTCFQCLPTEKPNEHRTQCDALQIRGINWNSNIISVIFILFSCVGLLMALSIALVFCKNNNNRIVRASGRDLCYTILIGICLTFICPFVFLIEPNKTSCILRGALPGFSFLTCYAPLFLKTNRIYRIFFSARVSVTRPSLVSSQSQFAAMFGLLALQVIVSVVWFSSQIPVPVTLVSKDSSYVTMHCSSDSNPVLLVLNLSLSVLFMICCTVLAFKTRHFPKNYNEAKYIGITLYVTCVVWALFLPIFFLVKYVGADFLREYLMCIVCILIGFITLFGMFGPKILMVYQAPPPSTHGSLPTWYVPSSKDNHDDQNQENTAFTAIS